MAEDGVIGSHEIGVGPSSNEGMLIMPNGETIYGPENKAGNPGAEMRARREAAKEAPVVEPVAETVTSEAPTGPFKEDVDCAKVAGRLLQKMFNGVTPYVSESLPPGTCWTFPQAEVVMFSSADFNKIMNAVLAGITEVSNTDRGWAIENKEAQDHPTVAPLLALAGSMVLDK
jgi:hypothetical protein